MPAQWRPAAPGDPVQAVDTPALILDLDAFETNLALMRDATATHRVRVRPHAKSHKCPEIARRQVAVGAVGICCQKVAEAEVFLAGGIEDVLITNEIVGERKLRRLADLARAHPRARVGVCVDDPGVVAALGAICQATGASLDVYVELDVGQQRCGVDTAAEVVALARAVTSHPSFTFKGIQAYSGRAQHRRRVSERVEAIALAARKAGDARAALLAAGLPCAIVTGGGTGTFLYEAGSGDYDEVQPGSYVLMDSDYAANDPDPAAPRFAHALFLLATVMSVRGDRVTLDAGLKAFSTDSGLPVPTFPGWQVMGASDEHVVLHRNGDGAALALGEKVRLIPSHCDPTVNLHEWFVGIRRERVESLWPIEARGAFF